MRFKHYMRRFIGSESADAMPFDQTHYGEAGVGYQPVGGMPVLEAHMLVNKWNRMQSNPRFLYWLE